MAKPMPVEPPDGVTIMRLMPTSWPFMSTRAPPELPGLMAASVWMKYWSSDWSPGTWAKAETMPLVTVWPTPKGSPMASTRSPTSTLSELAKASVGRFGPAPVIRSTARSER